MPKLFFAIGKEIDENFNKTIQHTIVWCEFEKKKPARRSGFPGAMIICRVNRHITLLTICDERIPLCLRFHPIGVCKCYYVISLSFSIVATHFRFRFSVSRLCMCLSLSVCVLVKIVLYENRNH